MQYLRVAQTFSQNKKAVVRKILVAYGAALRPAEKIARRDEAVLARKAVTGGAPQHQLTLHLHQGRSVRGRNPAAPLHN